MVKFYGKHNYYISIMVTCAVRDEDVTGKAGADIAIPGVHVVS